MMSGWRSQLKIVLYLEKFSRSCIIFVNNKTFFFLCYFEMKLKVWLVRNAQKLNYLSTEISWYNSEKPIFWNLISRNTAVTCAKLIANDGLVLLEIEIIPAVFTILTYNTFCEENVISHYYSVAHFNTEN